MMKSLKRLAVILMLGIPFVQAAVATEQTLHLRGVISEIKNDELIVVSRDGSKKSIRLSDQTKILDVSRADLSVVKENTYLGVAAVGASSGKLRALGIMIFPEGARGLNEGHFPWDKGPSSSMTNATVAKLVKKKNGTELEMRFGDKSKIIVVDSKTKLSQFVPGTKDLLVAKSNVMVVAQMTEGGVVNAQIILVGRDGFIPPI